MKTFVSKKAAIKTLITIPSILVLAACGGGGGGGGGSAATVTNTAPVFTSGIPTASVAQGVSYNFDVNATDVDGDTLVYSLTGNPGWLGIDPATGEISGIPDNADVGTTPNNIVVSVTDNNSPPVSQAAFSITVTNVNDAPTISGTPQTVTIAGGMYDFTPTASDVDVGDTLMYSVSGNDSWLSIDANTGQLTGSPMPSDVRTTTVTVTVTDSSAATDTLTFDLVVANGFNEALYSQVTPSPASSPAT
ncbi:MAG: putative Ig domain-containing protein, partial [Gammaproteobacteria bacterium]|nr:putative Ig domain-containing protein [Gammaproteobacteria bacterium]